MKRILLVLLVAVMTANFTFAQIKIGLRAGVNLAKLAGDEADEANDMGFDTKYKPGFQLGVVMDIPLKNENFVFQPGIIFSQTGTKFNGTESEDVYGYTIKAKVDASSTLNYIQIPANFQYRHDLGGTDRKSVV